MGIRTGKAKQLPIGSYVVRPEIAHREVEGQILILTPLRSSLFTLNGSAALLWPELVDGCSHIQLVESIVRAYDIEPARAERDVSDLLRDLQARGIVARRRR